MEQNPERMSSTLFQTSENHCSYTTFHGKATGNQKYAQKNLQYALIFTFASSYVNRYYSQYLSKLHRDSCSEGVLSAELEHLVLRTHAVTPDGNIVSWDFSWELLMQAGFVFEHMPPYCCSASKHRVHIVPKKEIAVSKEKMFP